MGFLRPERRVHDHGVAGTDPLPAPAIPQVCAQEGDVRFEKIRIPAGHGQCPLVDVDADNGFGPQECRTDGEHPGPAPEIADPLSPDIPLHQGVVEEPGGERGRRLVLLERCPRAGEPGQALEGHLEVLQLHRISSIEYWSQLRAPQRISNSCGERTGTGNRTWSS